jgi:predicted alpha/beta-fold hydrolase
MYSDFARVKYRREVLTVSALQVERLPGIVSLDWSIPACHVTYTDQTPTVLLLHGLAGGSSENYIRVTASHLMNCGYRCVVMNARGCNGTQLVTPQLFCANYTDDVRQVVWHLQRRLPNAPLCAMGFSLGANILVKYLGEEAADCPLAAAIAVCKCAFVSVACACHRLPLF